MGRRAISRSERNGPRTWSTPSCWRSSEAVTAFHLASRTARWSLHPHRLVSYKYVALVLASAQRLGVNKIGLIGNEAFLD